MNLHWSSTLIKYVLFVFNLIFVITGIVIITIGVSVKAYYSEYNSFLDEKYFSLPNLLIATGIIIFLISFLGCWGAIRDSWFIIFCFSTLLILIFILEFSAGIAGYVLRSQTQGFLTEKLTTYIEHYEVNETKNQYTTLWDAVQNYFHCCGVESASDWKQAKYYNSTFTLPQSCCQIRPGIVGPSTCTLKNNDTAIPYAVGCETAFGDFLREHALSIGSAGLTIAVMQLIGILFACYLSRRVREGYVS